MEDNENIWPRGVAVSSMQHVVETISFICMSYKRCDKTINMHLVSPWTGFYETEKNWHKNLLNLKMCSDLSTN